MYVNKVSEILNSITQPQSNYYDNHESNQNTTLNSFLNDISSTTLESGELPEISAIYSLQNSVPFNEFSNVEATLIAEICEAKKESFQQGFCEGLKFMSYLTDLRAR